jgi:lipid-A-disaccharide synthase-like uncharacterized protein
VTAAAPKLPGAEEIRATVQRALEEDVGSGDVTARLVPANGRARARVVAREAGVLCGCAWFDAVYRELDPRFIVQWIASERARRSIVPETFWYFSFLGGAMLFAYAIYRVDPVFILGQGSGLLIYARNIHFIWSHKKETAAAAAAAAAGTPQQADAAKVPAE